MESVPKCIVDEITVFLGFQEKLGLLPVHSVCRSLMTRMPLNLDLNRCFCLEKPLLEMFMIFRMTQDNYVGGVVKQTNGAQI